MEKDYMVDQQDPSSINLQTIEHHQNNIVFIILLKSLIFVVVLVSCSSSRALLCLLSYIGITNLSTMLVARSNQFIVKISGCNHTFYDNSSRFRTLRSWLTATSC